MNIFLKANLRKTIRGLITSKRADFDSHRTKKVDAMFTCSDFKILRICILVLLQDTLLWAIKENGTWKIGC